MGRERRHTVNVTLLIVEPLEPAGYAGLNIWDFSFRAALDFPAQLLFTGGDAE